MLGCLQVTQYCDIVQLPFLFQQLNGSFGSRVDHRMMGGLGDEQGGLLSTKTYRLIEALRQVRPP